MPLIQLTRNLTYDYGQYHFVRGVPQDVSEDLFHILCRTGGFEGAGQYPEVIYLRALRALDSRQESIVVMRDVGLGDVLMLWPSVRGLKQKFPGLRITYAVDSRYVDLFRGWAEDYVEAVVPIVSLQGHFKAIDLRGYSERADDRKTEHRLDVFAKYLQVHPLADRSIRVRLQPPEIEQAETVLRTGGWDGRQPLAMVAWRGSTWHRSLPPEILQQVLVALRDERFAVVVVDEEPQGMAVDGVMNLTGKTSVRQLAAILSHASVVVSPDTGVYHLAQAVGRPTVVIFSTVEPDKRVRYYERCEVIWHKEVPCAPCWDTGCLPIPCLMRVTASEVLAAVRRLVPEAATAGCSVAEVV
jgi:ADP-heptose:LPS heptosyltransferase